MIAAALFFDVAVGGGFARYADAERLAAVPDGRTDPTNPVRIRFRHDFRNAFAVAQRGEVRQRRAQGLPQKVGGLFRHDDISRSSALSARRMRSAVASATRQVSYANAQSAA
jgi:hypothetical protein